MCSSALVTARESRPRIRAIKAIIRCPVTMALKPGSPSSAKAPFFPVESSPHSVEFLRRSPCQPRPCFEDPRRHSESPPPFSLPLASPCSGASPNPFSPLTRAGSRRHRAPRARRSRSGQKRRRATAWRCPRMRGGHHRVRHAEASLPVVLPHQGSPWSATALPRQSPGHRELPFRR